MIHVTPPPNGITNSHEVICQLEGGILLIIIFNLLESFLQWTDQVNLK